MENDIFDSVVRSTGDLAGVLESDEETTYFYLYEIGLDGSNKILGAIRVASETLNLQQSDLSIRWDANEQKVGLFVKGVLWAVFDHGSKAKFGGDYGPEASPNVPQEAASGFSIGA